MPNSHDFMEKLDTSVYNAHVLHIASHMLSNPAKVFLPCGLNCGTVMFLFFPDTSANRGWYAGVFVFQGIWKDEKGVNILHV